MSAKIMQIYQNVFSW